MQMYYCPNSFITASELDKLLLNLKTAICSNPHFPKTKKSHISVRLSAEREGFEPPDLLQSTVFKTAAIDRSAISPRSKLDKMNDFQRDF